MSAQATLSSKGQLVIPKNLRKKMRLHAGSKLILKLTGKNSLDVSPVKNDISKIFGMGKRDHQCFMSVEDMDKAIGEAVIKNDRH
jgi:AbrB family looped-hinge helix DNA binding protein